MKELIEKYIYHNMVECEQCEQWLPIPGYTDYSISNTGKIRLIRTTPLSFGSVVTLTRNKIERNTFSCDRLAAKMFNTLYKGEEEWKCIDWNPDYQISNYSNVRALRCKLISVTNNRATLFKDGKPKLFTLIVLYLTVFPPYSKPLLHVK
jgi:hypothetical protein